VNAAGSLIRGVDHIVVKTDRPEPLRSLLSDTFRWPVSWFLVLHPWFASTGICAGNVDLEIVRLGPPLGASGGASSGAGFSGIALLPYSLPGCREELDRRGIPHSAPVPCVRPGAEGEEVRLWTNLNLADLAGHGLLVRLSAFLSRFLVGGFWTNVSLATSFVRPLWLRALLDGMSGRGMVFFVDYEPRFLESLSRQRALARADLRAHQGGPLGLRRVSTIVVGARDCERAQRRWQKLLEPEQPVAPGVWRLGNGLTLRLTPHTADAFLALVLEVASIEKASRFLAEQGMLGSASEHRARIDPSSSQGLEIWLVEAGAVAERMAWPP